MFENNITYVHDKKKNAESFIKLDVKVEDYS